MRLVKAKDITLDYLAPRARIVKPESLEEDVRMLVSQYTPSDKMLQLFKSTKLSKYLPPLPTFIDVERAAYRYLVAVLERIMPAVPSEAFAVYNAYRTAVLVRDVDTMIKSVIKGRVPEPRELVGEESTEVREALKLLASEGERALPRVLAEMGFPETAKVLSKVRGVRIEAVSALLDVELVKAFSEACRSVAGTPGEPAACSRLDSLALRAAWMAATLRDKELSELLGRALRAHRLDIDELRRAAIEHDVEAVRKLARESPYGRPSSELPLLEGAVARIRRYAREHLIRGFAGDPLSPGLLAAVLEQFILDAEDIVIVAVSAYSRLPKSVVAELVSLPPS